MPPDENTTNYITRAEYEARHASLTAMVSQIETRIYAEQATTKVDIDKKFEKLIKGLEDLKENITDNRAKNLRYVVSVLASFLIGGGGIALLEYLLKGK